MAGVLIEMRTAILRRGAHGKRALGGLALAPFATLLAGGTLWAGLIRYHVPGAGTDVLATLSFGWLLGWVTGPLLTGDDATLRMDYFKLLPVPARKLARAMMGAAFANVALIFSLIAFASLIVYGAQSGPAAALAGVAAVLLDLILAVVASTVAVAVFGPVISSRRGRDFGTMAFALVITLLSVASGLVPVVARRLTDGHSPALSAVVAAEPALVLASTGLLALISVVSVNGPTADGGPSPMRVLKTHLALIAVPAAALFPVAALLIAGTAGHLLWLQWLAVPAGIAWGALLGGRCGQLAQRRLDQQAPEIFSRVRGPAA